MSITALTSSLTSTLRWSVIDTADLARTTDTKTLSHTSSKTLGTATGEANLVWHDIVQVASTISLNSLPRSVFGVSGTYNLSSVKTIRIRNAGTGTASVSIPALGIPSPLPLAAGAMILLDSPAGWAATGTVVIAGTQPVELVIVGVGTVTG